MNKFETIDQHHDMEGGSSEHLTIPLIFFVCLSFPRFEMESHPLYIKAWDKPV